MSVCQKNGHRLNFSIESAERWWVFVRFAGNGKKRRVEIDPGIPGQPPVLVDCGSHPDGHVEFRPHDTSNFTPEVRVFHGELNCNSLDNADIPLVSGVNLVEDESDKIKFSSWNFQIAASDDSVGITVIIENNITVDP